MKRYPLIVIALLLAVSITACSTAEEPVEEPVESIPTPELVLVTLEPEPVVVDPLIGEWDIAGVYYNGALIDIHDNAVIEDLYDGHYLFIEEDQAFQDINSVFIHSGHYQPIQIDNSDMERYLLTSEEYVFNMREMENDGWVRMITVMDDNTLLCQEYDEAKNQALADADPIVFVREGCESAWLQERKTPLSTESEAASSTPKESESPAYIPAAVPSGSGDYEDILEEYTEKLYDAAPRLAREYLSEAAYLSGIDAKADLCNEKVGDLAEICNEGVGEMADLMFENDDDYSVYESWATKLMDVYTDAAEDIFDAYLEDATS